MNNDEKKDFWQDKISKALKIVGSVIIAISAIANLIVVYILIKGFKAEVSSEKLLVFLLVNAVFGVMMIVGGMIQGKDLSKSRADVEKVLNDYSDLISNDKEFKLRSYTWHFWAQVIQSIFTKGLAITISMFFAIKIIIDGLQDDKYFVLAITNVILYLGLSFLGLAKSYDYYKDKHIPYLRQKMKVMEEKQNVNEFIARDYGTDGTDGGRRTVKSTNGSKRVYRGSYSEQRDTNWDGWRFKSWKRNIEKRFNTRT